MTEQEQFEAYFKSRLAEPPLSLWKFWKMGTRKTNTAVTEGYAVVPVEPPCTVESDEVSK